MLPTEMRILGQTWTVNTEPMQRDGRLGHSDVAQQRLDICEDQVPGQLRDTLLHEVLHACINSVGVKCKHGERIVAALSPVLLDALRSNPALVTFLLGDA